MPNPQSPHQLIAGRYRLESVLGRGGMGVVWRATDELMGRAVAVKEVRVPLGLPTEERQRFAERALREARSAGRINHPAVVAIHDVVPASGDDEAVYIVTELVDAPTLADLLDRDGALPPDRVTTIAVRVLDALKAAHAVGVVHRDVKPGNIMVLPGDEVKLLDFGIAHAAGDTRLTRQGMMGSTGYLAPELFHGDDPTPAADLWSVGVTLAQAVTGELPFEGASTAATLHAVLYDDLPAIECGEPLATVIAGLLTRDVAQRLTVEQARDLLDAPVSAGAPGRRDSRAAAEPAPAGRGPTPVDEAWERHATTVQPAGPPPPRQRPGPDESPASAAEQPAVNFLAVVPRATLIANIGARIVLLGAALWVTGLLATLLLVQGRPDWTLIPVVLIGLVVGVGLLVTVVNPPHGWLHLSARSIRTHFWRGTPMHVLWAHIAAITVGPGAGRSAKRSRIGVELTPDAPPETTTRWKARGVLHEQDGRGPVWTVGDLEVSPTVLVDELGAVAPGHVRVVGPTEDTPDGSTRAFLPLGRRWPFAVVSFVLLTALIVTGHLYLRHHRSAMVELDRQPASALAFSGDSTTLVTANSDTFSITFWDVAARRAVATIPGHTKEINVLRFSPDGKTLASGGDDGAVKLWDVASRQNTGTLTFNQGGTVEDVLFSPSGDLIGALGYSDVKLWRLSSPDRPVELSSDPAAGPIEAEAIRFTSDGQVLIALGPKGVPRAWETASGLPTTRVDGAVTPWVEATRDSKVLLRTPGSNQIVATLVGDSSATFDATAFGPKDLFIGASLDEIRIWHTSTGRTAHLYKPGIFPAQEVSSDAVAMSPAGIAAFAGTEGLWLWTYGSAS
ncbi:serine/threonine-protein kinase [Micromonospora sp. NPDC049204]|uniref:WD40 repeat domain-containing serine/threonine protein kinase n=1 Tax=unclassified Micromonospora TaxID=2617518 RepID=UPI0033D6C439